MLEVEEYNRKMNALLFPFQRYNMFLNIMAIKNAHMLLGWALVLAMEQNDEWGIKWISEMGDILYPKLRRAGLM